MGEYPISAKSFAFMTKRHECSGENLRLRDKITAFRRKLLQRWLVQVGSLGDDVQLGAKDLAATPRISFDKAVLERHDAVADTLDAMWRDVGTWGEVSELFPADRQVNREAGKVHFVPSRDTFIFSPNRLSVGIGLTDLVVVDTPVPSLSQNRIDLGLVREAVEAVAENLYPEVTGSHYRISTMGVSLGPGETLNVEPYPDTERYWIVLQGRVKVTRGRQFSSYDENQSFYIPSGQSHAIGNVGKGKVNLIKMQLRKRLAMEEGDDSKT